MCSTLSKFATADSHATKVLDCVPLLLVKLSKALISVNAINFWLPRTGYTSLRGQLFYFSPTSAGEPILLDNRRTFPQLAASPSTILLLMPSQLLLKN